MFVITSCDYKDEPDPELTEKGRKQAQKMYDKLVELTGDVALYDMIIAIGEGRRHAQIANILFDRNPEIIDPRLGMKTGTSKGCLLVDGKRKIPFKEILKDRKFRKFARTICPFLKILALREKDEGQPLIVVGNNMTVAATGVPYKEVEPNSIYLIDLTDELKFAAEKVF